MIWRIEDANGRVIKEVNAEPKEVMNPNYAYTMIELMKGVAQFGTASGELGRKGISKDVEIAGKTGTTQNNSDGMVYGNHTKIGYGSMGRMGRQSNPLLRNRRRTGSKNGIANMGNLYEKGMGRQIS